MDNEGASVNGSLGIYTHFVAANEFSSFTWTADVAVYNASVVLAYSGADPAAPVDVAATQLVATGTSFAIPVVTSTVSDELVVAAVAGHSARNSKAQVKWTAPSGATTRAEAIDTFFEEAFGLLHSRATAAFEIPVSAPSAVSNLLATSLLSLDHGVSAAVVLCPCQSK